MAVPAWKNRRSGTPSYSAGEELAHRLTHGAGALLSIVGLVALWTRSSDSHAPGQTGSAIVYGATLILLFTASAAYHTTRAPRARHVAKILDHAGIYLLIAGTYTPLTLVTLRGPWGWTLFGVEWGLALIGVSLEALWTYRPKWVSVAVYLAMGWLVVIAARPLAAALPPRGLGLLVGGGLVYSVGTIFYAIKSVPYMHALWHLFVLGGSMLHYFAVLLYVLPSPR